MCAAGAVARITQKILALAKHMRTNRKDFSARRCWSMPELSPACVGVQLER